MCVGSVVLGDERKDAGNILQLPAGTVSRSELDEIAMPELGDGNLAGIISRYYSEGLGGVENWNDISSLKIVGSLELETGNYEFKAYQKKPNLAKMTIRGGDRGIMLGYDGEVAWEKLSKRGARAELMSEPEARRFKYKAKFASLLLYPFAEGKKIEYIDTVPMDGNICHHVQVTLDDAYQVDYFIDIRSSLEVKVVRTDLKDGVVHSVICRDYDRISGMPVARHVESYEAGEWVSTLTVEEVKVNSGVIPWMFRMPR